MVSVSTPSKLTDCNCSPERAHQRRTVPSSPVEITAAPSRAQATDSTSASCPLGTDYETARQVEDPDAMITAGRRDQRAHRIERRHLDIIAVVAQHGDELHTWHGP